MIVPVQLGGETAVGALIIVASLILLMITVNSMMEVVGPGEQGVLTVFGRYRRLLNPGINFVPPFISKIYSVSKGMQEVELTDQTAITRDDVVATVDIELFVQVMDAKKAALDVDDYEQKLSTSTVTTLRKILESMDIEDAKEKDAELGSRIEKQLRESAADDPTKSGVVEREDKAVTAS
ncbi:SPFH domain-containing protein [Halococcus salifodinae]|uniref:Band 7 domain-containing protein n=1 Tax=Halococcus salifodinae DSM 8989 TaxID=1227456 RepID=M0NHB6_9EURY|nr:SPFH domain-containing protein [Halococcus salifodinae]EMA56020.1 hypothetical protein C450_00010 [Halococcus salifodinae DSM 8989]